jgi:hypothetical protein
MQKTIIAMGDISLGNLSFGLKAANFRLRQVNSRRKSLLKFAGPVGIRRMRLRELEAPLSKRLG